MVDRKKDDVVHHEENIEKTLNHGELDVVHTDLCLVTKVFFLIRILGSGKAEKF